MISCVDTNVIIDVIIGDPTFAIQSQRLLERAYRAGSLSICNIVYAELVPQYDTKDELDTALELMGIRIAESGSDVAYLAGKKWAEYRSSGGTRGRVLPDFIIGAHALLRADCLLTRDRGFYATYFPELKVLER
jgi:predicted nucleic acid-binding protein